MKPPRPIRGIIPPAGRPRPAGWCPFAALLNHLIEGGSAGLFILGSTGELPGLSARLRREVIDCACDVAGTRLHLLVGGVGNRLMAEPYLALGKEKRVGIRALEAVGLLNAVVTP